MKISQKQADLLAREIIRQLKLKRVERVPDAMKKSLESFIEKRKQLYNKKADVQEEINKHEMSITKITGKVNGLYGGDNLSRMIEKLEEKNIPKFDDIRDEIILKSMFANEDDMNKFVSAIVKKHETFHLTGDILFTRGIGYCYESEEAFAYLNGWLSQEIFTVINTNRPEEQTTTKQ